MYRIRVFRNAPPGAQVSNAVVAEADVIVQGRFVEDLWQVHARCPKRKAWEVFGIKWAPGTEHLLRLVAAISMHMGRDDEYTLDEAWRVPGAYQPGFRITVQHDKDKRDGGCLQVTRAVDDRRLYCAEWNIQGQRVSLARTIEYAPAQFDVWALVMRSSLLLAVKRYTPTWTWAFHA